MARTIDYQENKAPPDNSEIAVVQSGTTYKIKLKNASKLVSPIVFPSLAWEFLNPSNIKPFFGTAISAGTITAIASIAKHPGILRIASVAAANSGYALGLNENPVAPGANGRMYVVGDDVVNGVFRMPTTTDASVLMGIANYYIRDVNLDAGVYIYISGTTLRGGSRDSSVETITTTTYSVVANTWYSFRIIVNGAMTEATFFLYDEAGTLLWSDTITTNIPTIVPGNEVDLKIYAAKTSAGAANILDIDFFSFQSGKLRTR